jgi:hypothetical protein
MTRLIILCAVAWMCGASSVVDVQLLPVASSGGDGEVMVLVPRLRRLAVIVRNGSECVGPSQLWDWGAVRSYHPMCAYDATAVRIGVSDLLTMFYAVEFCDALGYVALHTLPAPAPICGTGLDPGGSAAHTFVAADGTQQHATRLVRESHTGGDWLGLHATLCAYVAWLLLRSSSRLVCGTILALAGGILPSIQHDARDVFRFVSESLRSADARCVDAFFAILYVLAACGYLVFLLRPAVAPIVTHALLSPLIVGLGVCCVVVSPSHMFSFFFATLVGILFVTVATRDAANALLFAYRNRAWAAPAAVYVVLLGYLVWFYRALLFVPAFEILVPLAPIRGVAATALILVIVASVLADVYTAGRA